MKGGHHAPTALASGRVTHRAVVAGVSVALVFGTRSTDDLGVDTTAQAAIGGHDHEHDLLGLGSGDIVVVVRVLRVDLDLEADTVHETLTERPAGHEARLHALQLGSSHELHHTSQLGDVGRGEDALAHWWVDNPRHSANEQHEHQRLQQRCPRHGHTTLRTVIQVDGHAAGGHARNRRPGDTGEAPEHRQANVRVCGRRGCSSNNTCTARGTYGAERARGVAARATERMVLANMAADPSKQARESRQHAGIVGETVMDTKIRVVNAAGTSRTPASSGRQCNRCRVPNNHIDCGECPSLLAKLTQLHTVRTLCVCGRTSSLCSGTLSWQMQER